MSTTVQAELAVLCTLTLTSTKAKYRLQESMFKPTVSYIPATDSEHDSVEKNE